MSITDLAPHGLVLEPRGTAFRDELDRAAAGVGVELSVFAEVDGMTLVASLAFRGHGLAVLPATATMLEPAGEWTTVRIPDLVGRGVGVARRRGGRLAAPARVVDEVIREVVERDGPRYAGVELTA